MLRPVLLFLLCLPATQAAPLFSQPPSLSPAALVLSAAHGILGGPGQRRFEEFGLAAGTTVHEIVWWGMQEDNPSLFEVSIYSRNNVWSPIWTAAPISVRRDDTILSGGYRLHRYAALLANPFVAPEVDFFSISVFHTSPGVLSWGWLETPAGRNGSLMVKLPADENRTLWRDYRNLAFELNEVPEPGYQALLALFLLVAARLHHHRPHLHRAFAPRVKALPHRDRFIQVFSLNQREPR